MLSMIGCRSIPPEVEGSSVYQSWVKEIEDAQSSISHMRIAGYNSAILIGKVAGVETNGTNTVVASCLSLTDVRTIRAEFSTHRQQYRLLFSDKAVFGDRLPATGEVWVVHGRANAGGIWFVDGGLFLSECSEVTSVNHMPSPVDRKE